MLRINKRETGLKIWRYMTDKGMTQHDLQKLCNISHVQGVYRWLSGENLPTIDRLVILADAFGVKVDDLLVIER